jgi:hypothetical protein
MVRASDQPSDVRGRKSAKHKHKHTANSGINTRLSSFNSLVLPNTNVVSNRNITHTNVNTNFIANSNTTNSNLVSNRNLTPKTLYSSRNDKTLTKSQAKKGAFRGDFLKKKNSSFRSASNKTLDGHRSGYHESFLTTDTAVNLRKTHKTGKFPETNRKVYAPIIGKEIDRDRIKAFIDIADGSRTDTAQTVLSGPNNKAAGHSGSNVSTVGQSRSHDLIRNVGMDALMDTDLNVTEAVVLSGALTVSSMAPGVEANKLKSINKLKSSSPQEHEPSRNMAKKRVFSEFGKLSAGGRARVRKHMKPYFKSINDDIPTRFLGKGMPTSPLRKPETHPNSFVSGMGYDLTSEMSPPSITIAKNAKPKEKALYLTQPFRANRRK